MATFKVDDLGLGLGDVMYNGTIVVVSNMGDQNGTYRVTGFNEVERTISCEKKIEIIEKGFKLICGNCGEEHEINADCLHSYAWGIKRTKISEDTEKSGLNIWSEEDEGGIVIECKCGNVLYEY